MRYLLLFIGLSLLCGCSKSSQPESQTAVTNQVVEKTLSGIFSDSFSDGFFRYDFRTDGTVIYTAKILEAVPNVDAIRTTVINGRGNYRIQGDKVAVGCHELIQSSFSPDYGVVPADIMQTNVDLFRIDGDDLIHLLVIPNGEVTNIDANETRFIKQR